MPVDIEFSKHALLKISVLEAHGIKISKEMIEDVVLFPDKTEKGYKDRLIAQKRYNDEHVLRVVYEKHPERIFIITVYPGRRSRYEKN